MVPSTVKRSRRTARAHLPLKFQSLQPSRVIAWRRLTQRRKVERTSRRGNMEIHTNTVQIDIELKVKVDYSLFCMYILAVIETTMEICKDPIFHVLPFYFVNVASAYAYESVHKFFCELYLAGKKFTKVDMERAMHFMLSQPDAQGRNVATDKTTEVSFLCAQQLVRGYAVTQGANVHFIHSCLRETPCCASDDCISAWFACHRGSDLPAFDSFEGKHPYSSSTSFTRSHDIPPRPVSVFYFPDKYINITSLQEGRRYFDAIDHVIGVTSTKYVQLCHLLHCEYMVCRFIVFKAGVLYPTQTQNWFYTVDHTSSVDISIEVEGESNRSTCSVKSCKNSKLKSTYLPIAETKESFLRIRHIVMNVVLACNSCISMLHIPFKETAYTARVALHLKEGKFVSSEYSLSETLQRQIEVVGDNQFKYTRWTNVKRHHLEFKTSDLEGIPMTNSSEKKYRAYQSLVHGIDVTPRRSYIPTCAMSIILSFLTLAEKLALLRLSHVFHAYISSPSNLNYFFPERTREYLTLSSEVNLNINTKEDESVFSDMWSYLIIALRPQCAHFQPRMTHMTSALNIQNRAAPIRGMRFSCDTKPQDCRSTAEKDIQSVIPQYEVILNTQYIHLNELLFSTPRNTHSYHEFRVNVFITCFMNISSVRTLWIDPFYEFSCKGLIITHNAFLFKALCKKWKVVNGIEVLDETPVGMLQDCPTYVSSSSITFLNQFRNTQLQELCLQASRDAFKVVKLALVCFRGLTFLRLPDDFYDVEFTAGIEWSKLPAITLTHIMMHTSLAYTTLPLLLNIQNVALTSTSHEESKQIVQVIVDKAKYRLERKEVVVLKYILIREIRYFTEGINTKHAINATGDFIQVDFVANVYQNEDNVVRKFKESAELDRLTR